MTRAIHLQIALLAGLLGLWADAAPAATGSKPERFAIVAAVSEYNQADPELSNLLFATRDMVSMKQVLEAQGYTVLQLQNAKATATNIRDLLRGLRSLVVSPKYATVVFYFVGHGFACGGDNYLATHGSNVDEILQKGLAMDEVKQLLHQTGAAQRLAIIDISRRDPDRKHDGRPCVGRNFFVQSDTKVLFSTSPGQFSYEEPALEQGRFTHFLVRALRGEAAGEDGYISWDNLKHFMFASMRAYSMNTLNRVQTPWAEEPSTGDVLIGKALARQ